MIYITGDTHGDINRFSSVHIPKERTLTENDYVIVCGDFGFIWDNDATEKMWLDGLESEKKYTILFLDGNHENFHLLNQFPIEEWNGGKVHRIRRNILHLMRGQIYTIQDKTFFTMGGAYSIDRYMREEGKSYWPEELPNDNEYKEAINNFKKHNNSVDYVLTHTAPHKIIRKLSYNPDKHDIQLTEFLQWVMQDCNFRHWYFGHWHEDKKIYDNFTALFFDTVKIE